jgi:hypothetical protein
MKSIVLVLAVIAAIGMLDDFIIDNGGYEKFAKEYINPIEIVTVTVLCLGWAWWAW